MKRPVPHRVATLLLPLIAAASLATCGEKASRGRPASSPEIEVYWGPRETTAGKPFNVQPSGKSALWIRVTGVRAYPDTRVLLGGRALDDVAVGSKTITAAVPPTLIEAPGRLELVIEEGRTGRRVRVGAFLVK